MTKFHLLAISMTQTFSNCMTRYSKKTQDFLSSNRFQALVTWTLQWWKFTNSIAFGTTSSHRENSASTTNMMQKMHKIATKKDGCGNKTCKAKKLSSRMSTKDFYKCDKWPTTPIPESKPNSQERTQQKPLSNRLKSWIERKGGERRKRWRGRDNYLSTKQRTKRKRPPKK